MQTGLAPDGNAPLSPPAAAEGVHFPRPPGRLYGFIKRGLPNHLKEPHQGRRKAVYKIHRTKDDTTTLTARGRVKPLNPLNLLNPHARKDVSIKGAHLLLRIVKFVKFYSEVNMKFIVKL